MAHSRKIYLNGKLVGEAPITGDETRDQDLAIQLLKDKGLYQETTLVQGMFRQAVSFATTASYLYKRDLTRVPRNGLSVAPFVVNSAFAIELYLKTLGQLHNTALRGHDLLKLFDGLPADAQTALQQHFSKSTWQCDIKTLVEYRSALAQLAQLRVAFDDFARGGLSRIEGLGGVRGRFGRVVPTKGVFFFGRR